MGGRFANIVRGTLPSLDNSSLLFPTKSGLVKAPTSSLDSEFGGSGLGPPLISLLLDKCLAL